MFEHEGNNYVVDGVFCIHVDDILTAGESVRCKEDAREPHGEPTCYAERLHVLLHRFKFGSADYGDKQTFCGCQMTQAPDSATVTFDLQKYIHQIKPLNIEKARKTRPTRKQPRRNRASSVVCWVDGHGLPTRRSRIWQRQCLWLRLLLPVQPLLSSWR